MKLGHPGDATEAFPPVEAPTEVIGRVALQGLVAPDPPPAEPVSVQRDPRLIERMLRHEVRVLRRWVIGLVVWAVVSAPITVIGYGVLFAIIFKGA